MLRTLLSPAVLKGLHAGIGALGLAGMAYGAKKAVDAVAERRANEIAAARIMGKDGGALGPPGYQKRLDRYIMSAPMRSVIDPYTHNVPAPIYPAGLPPKSSSEMNFHTEHAVLPAIANEQSPIPASMSRDPNWLKGLTGRFVRN